MKNYPESYYSYSIFTKEETNKKRVRIPKKLKEELIKEKYSQNNSFSTKIDSQTFDNEENFESHLEPPSLIENTTIDSQKVRVRVKVPKNTKSIQDYNNNKKNLARELLQNKPLDTPYHIINFRSGDKTAFPVETNDVESLEIDTSLAVPYKPINKVVNSIINKKKQNIKNDQITFSDLEDETPTIIPISNKFLETKKDNLENELSTEIIDTSFTNEYTSNTFNSNIEFCDAPPLPLSSLNLPLPKIKTEQQIKKHEEKIKDRQKKAIDLGLNPPESSDVSETITLHTNDLQTFLNYQDNTNDLFPSSKRNIFSALYPKTSKEIPKSFSKYITSDLFEETIENNEPKVDLSIRELSDDEHINNNHSIEESVYEIIEYEIYEEDEEEEIIELETNELKTGDFVEVTPKEMLEDPKGKYVIINSNQSIRGQIDKFKDVSELITASTADGSFIEALPNESGIPFREISENTNINEEYEYYTAPEDNGGTQYVTATLQYEEDFEEEDV